MIITKVGYVMVDEPDSAVFPTKSLINVAWIKEVNVNRPPCPVAGHTVADCVEGQRPGSAVSHSQHQVENYVPTLTFKLLEELCLVKPEGKRQEGS